MPPIDRKQAIREFKERKTPAGIFAVRGTSGVWVGSSRNLEAARNSLWFQLRLGSKFLNQALQEAWNTDGESAFSYEVLETLPDDIHPSGVADELEARRRHWTSELNAQKL